MSTGSSIYLSVASNNARYVVSLDVDDITTYDGESLGATPTPNNCFFGWSRTNLPSGMHTLEMDVNSPSSSDADAKRDLELPWMVELLVYLNASPLCDAVPQIQSYLVSRNLIRLSAAVEVIPPLPRRAVIRVPSALPPPQSSFQDFRSSF